MASATRMLERIGEVAEIADGRRDQIAIGLYTSTISAVLPATDKLLQFPSPIAAASNQRD